MSSHHHERPERRNHQRQRRRDREQRNEDDREWRKTRNKNNSKRNNNVDDDDHHHHRGRSHHNHHNHDDFDDHETTAEFSSLQNVLKVSWSRSRICDGWMNGPNVAATTTTTMMITILLTIGILFTLLDVLYILSHVEIMTTTMMTSMLWNRTSHHPSQQLPLPPKVVILPESIETLIRAKGPILDLIRDAGITFDPIDDEDLLQELPDWDDVVSLYGPNPILYGMNLENCQRFQNHSPKEEHYIGVAGTFNSGTNVMAELLFHNCYMPDRMKKYGKKNRGIRWQVPWGKHTPPKNETYRNTHKSKKDATVNATEIFPVVTIRDPLFWLKSMCQHPYTARWYRGGQFEHCPDFSITPTWTRIKYPDFIITHASILHYWNDFYQEYLSLYEEENFPMVMVRFEDLIFHPKEVTKQVCECAGGKMKSLHSFRYIVDSAKRGIGAHGKVRTGFVDALTRYGTELKRYRGFNTQDLEFIRQHLDVPLMNVTQYSYVDPTKAQQ